MKGQILTKISDATDWLFTSLGRDIRLATPLGLGKPNQLLNDIYDRTAKDPARKLKIYTALSLTPPRQKQELARRFLEPFARRQWGNDYPVLHYARDAAADRVPAHIQVHEFYLQAGSALNSAHYQRNYQSINYTHVAESILNAEVNVIVQLVAARNGRYSLSTNPDLTLDVADLYKQAGKPLKIIAVIHPELPFLAGEAEVTADFFDIIVQSPEVSHTLFALPRQPISPEEHLIGFYTSQLVEDQGTLQIGIGALSDAIASSLCLRQKDNTLYNKLLEALPKVDRAQVGRFEHGLYGLTEMLTDGFMHLRQAGVLKRLVTDDISGAKTFLHGSFVLGSKPFYEWLHKLPPEEANGLRMSRISKVNDLYDPNELPLRRQRIRARFCNTTMQVSLLGEAMSETLPNGSILSGVGGQYNFVAMAHELLDSLSILMLRSTRIDTKGKRASNIVWTPGHVTIPRHLRDHVVTEYGVANLKGATDEQCIQRLLNITDSEFQPALLQQAKAARKVAGDYQIPAAYRNNTPHLISQWMDDQSFTRAFMPFPFGSDFTSEEERIALALGRVQEDQKRSSVMVLRKALLSTRRSGDFVAELKRMNLEEPRSLKERLYRRILLAYL